MHNDTHWDLITPYIGPLRITCAVQFAFEPVVQVVGVDDGAGALWGGCGGDLSGPPALVVVEVGGEQGAALADGLELPCPLIPDEGEAAGLGDVAGGVQGEALPVLGDEAVGICGVGFAACAVAEAVGVGVVGEGLGFGGAGFAGEPVEGVVAVGGGATGQGSCLDVAVGVIGEGFVGLGGGCAEQGQYQQRGQDKAGQTVGYASAARLFAIADEQEQCAEQEGAPFGQGGSVAVKVAAPGGWGFALGERCAVGVEGAGLGDAVAVGLGDHCARSVLLDGGDQVHLRIGSHRCAELLDAAVGVALCDQQFAGGGNLGAEPVGAVPGVLGGRQGEAAFAAG
ncbi:MAG: hypothetical protein WBH09_03365, partial [Rugosibacter sp.]